MQRPHLRANWQRLTISWPANSRAARAPNSRQKMPAFSQSRPSVGSGTAVECSHTRWRAARRPIQSIHFDTLDLFYRTLCAVMYNYAPLSGHPGGSISSGRFVARLVFDVMDYDLSQPAAKGCRHPFLCGRAQGARPLCHVGFAQRDRAHRRSRAVAARQESQFRLEDLLGFRRNPSATTPLFKKFHARALDGHPTPATPFVRLSTGASGVGLPASLGLAWAAADIYGENAPRIHIVEGEGGFTPGRVAEALAAAGTASLDNVILHIDWNQASIDSNRVCREGETPGEYVQWTPAELAYLHDWNVILRAGRIRLAADHVCATPRARSAQRPAHRDRVSHDQGLALRNGRPRIPWRGTRALFECVLHRGRTAHAQRRDAHPALRRRATMQLRNKYDRSSRSATGKRSASSGTRSKRGRRRWKRSRNNCARHEIVSTRCERKPRSDAPRVELAYEAAEHANRHAPTELALKFGTKTTLREELGRVLNYYNRATNGAFVIAAADLLGSTSINKVGETFPPGFYNRQTNPGSRQLAIGGICEDAMMSMLVRHFVIRRAHRRRLELRRIQRTTRSHRRAAPRHR